MTAPIPLAKQDRHDNGPPTINLFVVRDMALATRYIKTCGRLVDDLVGDGFEGNMSAHPSELWAGFMRDGEVIGMIRFIPLNSVTAELHPIFARRHRGYSLLCVRKAIKWMLEGQIKKVVARFPKSARVEKACKYMGMTYQGTLTNSYLKNGSLSDMTIYGT